MRKINLRLFLVFLCLFYARIAAAYIPQTGDLFFQDSNCGTLCEAISQVTEGYRHTKITHVGIVVLSKDKPFVLEASGKGVQLTPLKQFLNRSLDDKQGPRVIVGRLKTPYRYLIPQAVHYALTWKGKPYNTNFAYANHFEKFYCSQLIYDAFLLSNHAKPFFKTHPMTFKKNNKTFPAWQQYFEKIKTRIPEGQLGTNPGMMSRSNKINIIYAYGTLRKVNEERLQNMV